MEEFGLFNLIQFTDPSVHHQWKWRTLPPSNNSKKSSEERSPKSSRTIRNLSPGLMSLSSGLKKTLVDVCPSHQTQNKRRRSRNHQNITLPTPMMRMRIPLKLADQWSRQSKNSNTDSSLIKEKRLTTKRLWQMDKSHSNKSTSKKTRMRNLDQFRISLQRKRLRLRLKSWPSDRNNSQR